MQGHGVIHPVYVRTFFASVVVGIFVCVCESCVCIGARNVACIALCVSVVLRHVPLSLFILNYDGSIQLVMSQSSLRQKADEQYTCNNRGNAVAICIGNASQVLFGVLVRTCPENGVGVLSPYVDCE